jgi:hypothetical protein
MVMDAIDVIGSENYLIPKLFLEVTGVGEDMIEIVF